MSKKNNSERKIVPQSVEIEETTPVVEVQATAAKRVKMTREEWSALSPDEKRTLREARRANRPSPAPRLAKNMTRLVKRLTRVRAMFGTSDVEVTCADQITGAINNLTFTAERLEALGTDWKPVARTGGATSRFEAGQFVQIAEKRRASFEGLLEADEMLELRVVKVVGKKLVLQTEAGTRLVLPQNVIAAK